MGDMDWLADSFESHRGHLRAVAYRMLGSASEADDAVQDAWLRLSRSDAAAIDNLGGWLTTVVARLCLNTLRSRTSRGERSLDLEPGSLPDPVVTSVDQAGPEERALVADSVGLALLVVLETLAPAERLAFVLHDMFAVPFDEIAPMVGRSPAATRQLASRARRRVQGEAPVPDPDVHSQREVVDAFFAAARDGNFDALLELLDPEVVSRADNGSGAIATVSGAATVARRALAYANPGGELRPVLVNGAAGVVVFIDGRPRSVMGFTVRDGRVQAIDSLADPERIAGLDLSAAGG